MSDSRAMAACVILVVVGLACTRCSPEQSGGGDAAFDAAVDAADASPEAGTADAAEIRVDDGADPMAWAPVPGADECELFVGDPKRLALSPPSWTDCGPGCVSSAGPAYSFPVMSRGDSSAAVVSGELILRRVLGNGVTGGPSRQQILRINDGTTLAVVDQRVGGCVITGDAPSAPLAIPFWNAKKGQTAGLANAAGGAPAFAKSWFKTTAIPLTTFAFADGVGWGFKDGTTRVIAPLTADALVTIDVSAAPPSGAVGRGTFVVWRMLLSSASEIRGWRAGETSASVYVKQTDLVRAVAQSDDKLAWISARGPEASLGRFAAADLRWSPRPGKPSEVVETVGPSLPATYGLADLQIGGDFAATIGEPVDRSRPVLIVVQFSTKKIWTLRGGSMDWWNTVLAVSDDEILVGATDLPGTFDQEIRRILRMKTARLDDLAKSW